MNIQRTANLHIKLMGRYYRVLAIATSTEEANKDMAQNCYLSVIHTDSESNMVYMADKRDAGRSSLD